MSHSTSPAICTILVLTYASQVFGAAVLASPLALRATNATTQSTSSTTTEAAATKFAPLGSATDVFREGGACRASWIPDTTGAQTWKSMTIQLMTGSNLQMTALGTVASGIDATNPTATVFNYACPQVSPNAAIYFLQYTHDGGEDPTWTTRFAIGDASGNTVAPPQSNQPQGGTPAIPWGEGVLVAVTGTSQSTSSASFSSSTTAAQSTTVTRSSAAASTSGSFAQQQKQLANAFSSALSGSSTGSTNSNDLSSGSTASMMNAAVLVSVVMVACSLMLL